MSRTAFFRLASARRPRPGRPGVDLFLPSAGRDTCRGEIVWLAVMCPLILLLGSYWGLRQVLPFWPAVLLASPVIFCGVQLVLFLLVRLEAAALKRGWLKRPTDSGLPHVVCLATVTALAVGGIWTPFWPVAAVWLCWSAANAAAWCVLALRGGNSLTESGSEPQS
jgi:hypothetical protein